MIGVLEKEVMVRNAGQPRPFHEPVLLAETIALLKPGSGKIFFDATVGGAARWMSSLPYRIQRMAV